jgi:hypothetical protein
MLTQDTEEVLFLICSAKAGSINGSQRRPPHIPKVPVHGVVDQSEDPKAQDPLFMCISDPRLSLQEQNTGDMLDPLDSASMYTIQQAASWLLDCLKNHNECNLYQFGMPSLPSRVIDVGPSNGSQEPFLYETHNNRGIYVTLSYRWEDFESFKLTLYKIPNYKTSIPLTTLSKTIQDAITPTRKLHIRYLWIDALCIIQDSLNDWFKEAANMATIYRNSLLTIAAGDSSRHPNGIFSRREALPSSRGLRPLGELDSEAGCCKNSFSPHAL